MMSWLSNADDPRIQIAISERACDICLAPKGILCRNTIQVDTPLLGRLVHHARLVDRRREPKEDT